MILCFNSLFRHFWTGLVRMRDCQGNSYLEAKKFILNSDCEIIQPITLVKTKLNNVDWIFMKTTD